MRRETTLKTVGQRVRRIDGPEIVTGRAVYADDIRLPGMLYGRILHSPHAHARIRGIDTRRARALPGVADVVTAADAPNIRTALVEEPAPHGPYGAKGVGEPPIIPGAAAIANAIHDAVGVRVTELPMTPERVLEALRIRSRG